MTVLDSSFLIEVERGTGPAMSLLRELETQADALRIPAAAWAEYLSTYAPTRRGKAVRELEASSTLEAFAREMADEAARLQSELMREGRGLAWHDLQVAATALYLRETLVTTDAAFRDLPGLDVRFP
jgi:predicted nucleic acid-binding protein